MLLYDYYYLGFFFPVMCFNFKSSHFHPSAQMDANIYIGFEFIIQFFKEWFWYFDMWQQDPYHYFELKGESAQGLEIETQN